MIVALMTST
jgi:hypothetical protein